MKTKIQINKRLSYLIIVILSLIILFLLKLLFNYPFFINIKNAVFNILFPFFISFIIVYIFHPLLYWFEKKFAIKTWFTTLILLSVNVTVLILLVEIFIPVFLKEAANLFIELPDYLDHIQRYLDKPHKNFGFLNNKEIHNMVTAIKDMAVTKLSNSIVNFAVTVFTFSIKSIQILIFIPILTFLIMKDYSLIYDKFTQISIRYKRRELITILKNIDAKMSIFLRGQIFICLYTFVLTYLMLILVGIPNALVFAFIVAVTVIIPYLGFIIGGASLWIYTLLKTPNLFVYSLLIILIITQVNLHVGKPLIFKNKLDLHPILIMALMIIGLTLAGILGLIFVVPFYIIIHEILVFYIPRLKKTKNL